MKKQYIIALSTVAVLAAAFVALYAYMHHPRTVEFTVEAAEETTGETKTVTTELTLTRTVFGNKRLSGTMMFGDETFYIYGTDGISNSVDMYKEELLASEYMNKKGDDTYRLRKNSFSGTCLLDTSPDCVSGVFITLFRGDGGYGILNYTSTETWHADIRSLPADVVEAIEDIIS